MVQIIPGQDSSLPSKGFSQYLLDTGLFYKPCSVLLRVMLAVTWVLSQPSVCSWGTGTSHGWRVCWNVLSYGHRLGNSWLYLDLKINLVYVPLHFGLIEMNFYFFKKMFVCVILSPSVLSSVPPVSFRHEVTALSVMSVCFHIDRPFCQKQDLDACFRWGKRGIQMVGRKSEEWEGSREKHTKQSLQGEMQSPNPTFPAEGKGLLSLGSGRSSKMCV